MADPFDQVYCASSRLCPARAATFADDLRANLKNVAIPGTGGVPVHVWGAVVLLLHLLQCRADAQLVA